MGQQVSGPQLLGHLVSKPQRLKEFCDSYGQYLPAEESNVISDPTQALNHPEEFDAVSSSVIESPGSGHLACNCQPHRELQRKRFFWSSLELFRDIRTEEYHLPSCPLSCFTNKVRQSWGVRHVTVSRLLGCAVQLSFSLTFGSGGFSMGPTINLHSTVDARLSPAFQAANMIGELAKRVAYTRGLENIINEDDIKQTERFLREAMLKIETSFHERKASPTDIDAENRTLIYPLLRAVCLFMPTKLSE